MAERGDNEETASDDPAGLAGGSDDYALATATSAQSEGDTPQPLSTSSGSHTVLEPGIQVTKNIELVRELGQGGMGSVWVAEHLTLRTQVAVKFVSEDKASEVGVKRFSREASLAAQIKSPHVVQTFDHGVTKHGLPYIVMELLAGESLDDRIERGPVDQRLLGMIINQVAKALKPAHKLGIIHRDLKPANLFLEESEYEVFIKVLDFGIAKRTGDITTRTGDITNELTGARSAIGTPYYMSPEALRATKALDQRADLWSVAVVAYHALTCRLPFHGDTFGDQLMLAHTGRFKPPSELVECSEALDGWFATAFNTDIAKRFQNADELANAFRLALGGPMSSASFDGAGSGESISMFAVPTTTGENESSADSKKLAEARARFDEEAAKAEAGDTEDEGVAEAKTGAEPLSSRRNKASRTDTDEKPSTLEGAAATGEKTAAGKSNRLIYGGLAAAAVVGVAYFALSAGEQGTDQTPAASATTPISAEVPAASTAAPEPSVTTTAAAAPSASATLPKEVELTIKSTPAKVTVKQGDKLLGTTPDAIKLPRSTEEVELTFSAPGYLPGKKKVWPATDQEVPVRLRPVPRKKPGGTLEW
ncbi:MAG: serine/threonine protein kinase [Deltaproteobacteria bacterium]|nr:serine/threonine protein kinase [Deltaproteobacteria bacterium]